MEGILQLIVPREPQTGTPPTVPFWQSGKTHQSSRLSVFIRMFRGILLKEIDKDEFNKSRARRPKERQRRLWPSRLLAQDRWNARPVQVIRYDYPVTPQEGSKRLEERLARKVPGNGSLSLCPRDYRTSDEWNRFHRIFQQQHQAHLKRI